MSFTPATGPSWCDENAYVDDADEDDIYGVDDTLYEDDEED